MSSHLQSHHIKIQRQSINASVSIHQSLSVSCSNYHNDKMRIQPGSIFICPEPETPNLTAIVCYLLCSSQKGCPPSEVVAVHLNSSLEVGAMVSLFLAYTGNLSPSQGVYRSSTFRDEEEGKDSVLLVTQLEQTGARHMFPCVDEPSSKVSLEALLPCKKCRRQSP